MSLMGQKLLNPFGCANIKCAVPDVNAQALRGYGEGMSEEDAEQVSADDILNQISGDSSILYVLVGSSYTYPLDKGKYAGGFYNKMSGQIYRYSEEKKKQLEAPKTNAVKTSSNTGILTVDEMTNIAKNLSDNISSKANGIVNDILDSTSSKDVSKLVEKTLDQLKIDKDTSQILSLITDGQNKQIAEQLINKNLDSVLNGKLNDIKSKYEQISKLTSQEYIDEKLNAIRSYKYAFVNDPKFKQEQLDAAYASINNMIIEGAENLKLSGEKYIDNLVNQYSPLIDQYQSQIDNQIDLVSNKISDEINKITELDEAKINNLLSNQIYDVVTKTEEIDKTIEDVTSKLSKIGVDIKINDKISSDLQNIADKISADTSKKILPIVQKAQDKAVAVTKTVAEVKEAINLAKQQTKEYIDKLKTMANDFIARETAILTQELSKYVKINIGAIGDYASKIL